MKHKTIPQALQYVADHPVASDPDTPLNMPMWELIARELFDIANKPDRRVKGAVARATKAQKMIYDRMVGRRKPGTHPAMTKTDEIEYRDLTNPGEISV